MREVASDAGALMLYSNDDIKVNEECVQLMEQCAIENPTVPFFYVCKMRLMGSIVGGGKFTVWLMRPQAMIDQIGFFDEQFSPAYFEDNDYAWRMKLANTPQIAVPGTVMHHWASSTLLSYTPEELEAHHKAFRLNEERYLAKWGGKPEFEKWTVPYGPS
jgi:hypothetical protein